MKQLIIIILFCLTFSQFTIAQNFATDRGSLMLDGGIWLSSNGNDMYSDGEDKRTFDFSFDPAFQAFVVPSLAIGAGTEVSFYSRSDYNYTTLGIGPKITYFIAGHRDMKVYPYIDISVFFAFQTFSFDGSSEDSNNLIIIANDAVGAVFMVNKAIGIDMSVGFYNRSNITEDLAGNKIYFSVGVKAFIF